MDLERIKQNFRIRSGRSRKPKKHHKPNGAPPQPKESPQTSAPLSNGTSSASSPQTPKKRAEQETATTSPSSANNTTTTQEGQAESRTDTEPPSESSPVSDKKTPNRTPFQDEEHPAEDIDGNQETATASSHPAESSPRLQRSCSASLDSEASSLELQPPDTSRTMTDLHLSANATSSEADDFDLAPPKRRPKPPSIETLSELLFSPGHLDTLLQHPPQLARFSAFLQRYAPQHYPLLAQYLETRKAIKAIEYANAVAEGLKPKETGGSHSTETRSLAAKLDPEFETICNASFDALMNDALPSYVSYSLVKVASEIMINEITGRSTPIMRDLVDGLSEVFCLTDPNQEDNPIIYASEEFYRLTRYGPDDVLNNNCRFLQGRKTNPMSPKRLKHAITTGEEINETLLNYRRDGRPFVNLLMIAPLHDRSGKLKYHIGAQIDVSGLVEGGRALEGFQRYLARRNDDRRREETEKAERDLDDDQRRKRRALARLRDLSETFDLEETAVVQAASRSNSLTREEEDAGSLASIERQKGHRRVYINSDSSEYGDADGVEESKPDDADWKLGEAGDGRLSGKLPGVYDSFILFRPAPSFRIVFVSPKLRKMGNALQTPFLSHIAAPNGTLNGLAESLRSGVPVAAKVHFTPERGERRDGTRLKSGTKHEDGKHGRAIWVSCTPLLGEDDTIGVWMCVVVEKSKVGSIRKRRSLEPEGHAQESGRIANGRGSATLDRIEATDNSVLSEDKKATIGSEASSLRREDIPIKPVRIDSQTVIKPQVEKSPESADAGQDQTSKTVRPQQSIYFDAEQGDNIDKEEVSNYQDPNQAVVGAEETVNGKCSPEPPPTQERDPRAVITPVQEYEDEGRNVGSYDFQTRDSSPASVYRDEPDDEYVATHSPVTPLQQSNSRVLIEEDSDVLQESDLEHQHDNMRVGRSRRRSSSCSGGSLNSPASDIPPSIPSSAMVADDGEDEYDGEHIDGSKGKHTDELGGKLEVETKDKNSNKSPDEKVETPITTRHHRSPTPPDASIEEGDENLDQSYATIKPAQDHSPARNSDRDSAISLDSPAQPRTKSTSNPTSKQGSKSSSSSSSHTDTTSQKTENDEQESRTPKTTEHENEIQTRERDIENWVTDSRPRTSRNNSDDQKPGHGHSHSHKHSTNTAGRNSAGLRLDFLGTNDKHWASRQPRPRRRLDPDFGDYDADDGGIDDDDDRLTRSDHCATSPYSVD